MSWESLIKKSGMVYILFKNRTGSLPPAHLSDAGYGDVDGYPVKAFSSYKTLYDFLLRQQLMELDPDNVESAGVTMKDDQKDREQHLFLIPIKLRNLKKD